MRSRSRFTFINSRVLGSYMRKFTTLAQWSWIKNRCDGNSRLGLNDRVLMILAAKKSSRKSKETFLDCLKSSFVMKTDKLQASLCDFYYSREWKSELSRYAYMFYSFVQFSALPTQLMGQKKLVMNFLSLAIKELNSTAFVTVYDDEWRRQ